MPLGFEYDRAVLPFMGANGFRAHRVHLLSAVEPGLAEEPLVERHSLYVDRVKGSLSSMGIEVIVHPMNMIDLLEVIKTVSGLIQREKGEGNVVYVNMSAAGRLASVGSTLAGMAHGVGVYYVKASGYSEDKESMLAHGYSICDELKVLMLENFRLELPNEVELRVLVELYEGELTTSDLLNLLVKIGVPGFEKYRDSLKREDKVRFYMRLDRGILEKLVRARYVVQRKVGRTTYYRITDSGKYVACISGLLVDDPHI